MSYDGFVEPERWGRDHHSTLLYLETRVVDHDGLIDRRHMRGHIRGEEYRYPTRLAEGELEGHNDFDCLRDFIHFGYVEEDAGRYSLTEKGWELAQELRKARAERGKVSA